MSVYYIGSIPFGQSDIQHFGVKGMKWGIRKYQNPDGTLTAAGQARYNQAKGYARRTIEGNTRLSGVVGAFAPGGSILSGTTGLSMFSKGGRRGFQERRAESRQKKADEARAAGKEKRAEKMQLKADAQRKKNAEVDKYVKSLSPGGILLQNFMNPGSGTRYREARARGRSAIGAWLESATPVIGKLAERHGEKKRYGAAAWSAMDD